MKNELSLISLGCCAMAVFMSSCTLEKAPVAVVQPVGPAPHEDANAAQTGYLMVYSAWGLVNENKAPVDHHSRYTLTSDDGKINRVVINHIDRFDEGPIRLPLKAGMYKVSALSAHSGRVIVPIRIEPRQTTYVYLDGQVRPNLSANESADVVRLPDGQIVGWATRERQ